jgi:hypothetical protein
VVAVVLKVNWPLVPALLELFSRRRRANRWKWFRLTLLRYLCSLKGAFKRLPLTHGLSAFVLAADPERHAAIEHVAAQTNNLHCNNLHCLKGKSTRPKQEKNKNNGIMVAPYADPWPSNSGS